MVYTAYCMPDGEGKVGLWLFLEGFDTSEAAQLFLRQLMAPYETDATYESDTVH